MEKNVYQILQDWHELLKSGVITEEEFAAKKNELLGGEKKLPHQEEIYSLTNEEQAKNIEADTLSKELFAKPKWYKQTKYWLGIFALFFTLIGSWCLFSNQEELKQERVISDLEKYLIKSYEKSKSKGGYFYKDSMYIDFFYGKQTIGEGGETSLEFYPKYSRYSNEWKQENEYKLEECIESYYFLFDTTKLNDGNRYVNSRITKCDVNNDGKTDYLVSGKYFDCSGGSINEQSTYILTYIGSKKGLILTNVFYDLLSDYTVEGNKITFSGPWKSWYKKNVYYFDKNEGSWMYNKEESSSYFNDK